MHATKDQVSLLNEPWPSHLSIASRVHPSADILEVGTSGDQLEQIGLLSVQVETQLLLQVQSPWRHRSAEAPRGQVSAACQGVSTQATPFLSLHFALLALTSERSLF